MNNHWNIYMLAFISFFVSTSEYVIAGILDQISDWANVSISAAGQLITVFALANAIGAPVVMMITTKMDRRKLLIIALAIVVMGSVMTITLSNFGLLILSRIVLAIGGGVFVIVAKTMAAQLAKPGKEAGAIGTILLGFSASLIVGVPLGRMIAALYGWKMIFFGIGVLALLAIFAVARMIPSTTGETPIPITRQLALIKNRNVLSGFAMTFFWQLGYAMLYAYMVPFLLHTTTMSSKQVSMALFAFGIATLIGLKVGGYMTDRLGISKTVLSSMSIHTIALILLSTVMQSVAATMVLLIVWAFSSWASGPGLQFNLMRLTPEASGIMLSLYGSILQLSIAAAGGIGGMVAGHYSIQAVGWSAAASVATACVLAGIAFRTLKRGRHNEPNPAK